MKTGAMQANLCAALMFFCSQEKPCPPAVQLSWKQIQGHYCISCTRTPTTSQDLEGCVWKAAARPEKYPFIFSPSALTMRSSPPQPLQLLTTHGPRLWEGLGGEGSPSTGFPPPAGSRTLRCSLGNESPSVPPGDVLGLMPCGPEGSAAQLQREKHFCRKPEIMIVMNYTI